MDQHNWKKKKIFHHTQKCHRIPQNTEKIRPAYESKHNFKRENQVITLMITDGKKWHYLTVKGLFALLKGMSSNHVGDFYCLNCFHWYRTEKKT